MLVFVHVLLHPWVHVMGASGAVSNHAVLCNSDTGNDVSSGDRCELCRVGHSATTLSQLPTSDLLNPRWVHTTLQAVNYASLQADRRLPSRAPPIL